MIRRLKKDVLKELPSKVRMRVNIISDNRIVKIIKGNLKKTGKKSWKEVI